MPDESKPGQDESAVPVVPAVPEQPQSQQDERDIGEFITRQVLEKGAVFFDG